MFNGRLGARCAVAKPAKPEAYCARWLPQCDGAAWEKRICTVRNLYIVGEAPVFVAAGGRGAPPAGGPGGWLAAGSGQTPLPSSPSHVGLTRMHPSALLLPRVSQLAAC